VEVLEHVAEQVHPRVLVEAEQGSVLVPEALVGVPRHLRKALDVDPLRDRLLRRMRDRLVPADVLREPLAVGQPEVAGDE
jgi:hypothetical protein